MTITEQALTTARTSHTSEASTRLTQPTQTNNEQSTIHPLITPLLYQFSLCWVILVDTDTLPGADQHAGENIENHWYGKAEQLSYRIFLGVVSFSCLLASLLGKDQWAFMLVCILIAMLLVFVLAYTIMRFISRG